MKPQTFSFRPTRASAAVVQQQLQQQPTHDDLFNSMGLEHIGGGVDLQEVIREARDLTSNSDATTSALATKLASVLTSAVYNSKNIELVLDEIDQVPHPTKELKRLARKQRKFMEEQNESTSVVDEILQEPQVSSKVAQLGRTLEEALDTLKHNPTRDAEEELESVVEDISDATGNDPALVKLKLAALKVSQAQKKRIATTSVVATSTPASSSFSSESLLVKSMITDINNLLARAMIPITSFAGAVSVYLRVPAYTLFLYQDDKPSVEQRLHRLVNQNATTMDEFLHSMADFGPTLQTLYLKARMEAIKFAQPPMLPLAAAKKRAKTSAAIFATAINSPCFEIDTLDERMSALAGARNLTEANVAANITRLTAEIDAARRANVPTAELEAELQKYTEYGQYQKALVTINLGETERVFAPAWAFEVIGSAVFRKLLSLDLLAAMDIALAEVKAIRGCETFTMKELICSPAVQGKFAFLVSSTFLMSGDNTTSIKASNRTRTTYLNIQSYRQSLAESRLTCKVWFESVGKRPNPVLHHFDKAYHVKFKQQVDILKLDPIKDYVSDAQFMTLVTHGTTTEQIYDIYTQAAPSDDAIEIFEPKRQAFLAWQERMKTYKSMMPRFELIQTRF
jgi:hypothetical protein